MTAAILKRGRLARRVEEENDVLPEHAKGFGPSSSWATGTAAYQKLRSTGWRVLSMGGFLRRMREAAVGAIGTQEPRRRPS